MKLMIDISEELYAKVPTLVNKGNIWIGDVLEAVKNGTPLEAQPNQCDTCTHSEEQDGSNCYECVKGMSDNFEAQPKTSYISIDLNKFAKDVAEKALYEITYEGKTIREWAEIIVQQQQTDADYISRSKLLRHQHIIYDDDGEDYRAVYVKDIKAMSSVYPERPKGKWIKVQSGDEDFPESIVCSRCKGENSHIDFNEHSKPIGKIFVMSKYCPNCGAYMSGGEEE